MDGGMKIADADIWRCVGLLVERHGDNAAIYAARHAEELGATGDHEGKAVWKLIMMGCLELRRSRMSVDEPFN
jgi:hypothetical protein